MIKLNLDAFARRAVPWRCTDTHVSPSRSPPGGHTTEAACSWSIRRGTLPPRPRRLVTEDGRLDTPAVGELLACGDVARREEGDVRQRLVAVLGQHAARGHVGLVARAVDEAGGVARVERIDGRRARRMPAPRQRQEGAAVGAVRRLLGAHVLAHVLEDEGALAEGREGAQRPARTVGAAEDLQVRLVRDRARVR